MLWEEPKRVATSCVVSQVNLSMTNGLVWLVRCVSALRVRWTRVILVKEWTLELTQSMEALFLKIKIRLNKRIFLYDGLLLNRQLNMLKMRVYNLSRI